MIKNVYGKQKWCKYAFKTLDIYGLPEVGGRISLTSSALLRSIHTSRFGHVLFSISHTGPKTVFATVSMLKSN